MALCGCYSWRSRPVSEIGTGATVYVVTDGRVRRAMLEGAAVSLGESVVGRLARLDTLRHDGWATLRRGAGERTAIPPSSITRVDRRELDKRRTYAPVIVVGGVAALVLLIGALFTASDLYG
jgi:hypothetical protein